ncbi:MAG TPA: FecR family protein [Candidatus Cloacimonadota bacterium]|nr:FecR family protein [Candidatus Cloacimonadota bacterium]HPS39473.1 FecR family protein [Candidatus Cloacimonadota bacterium]
MKRLFIIAIMALTILSLAATGGVAYLSANKGKVDLTRDKKPVKFKSGQMLNNEDVLTTGRESFAAYKYVDGSSTVKVFANSVVKIKAVASGKKLSKTVAISKGSVYSSVKKNKGSYKVDTPGTVASVKGTGFLTGVSDTDETRYIVLDGIIEIEIKATGEKKDLPAGKTATIDTDGNYTEYNSTEDELQDIQDLQDEAGMPLELKTMRIPVQNEAGQIKYIEIKY